MGIAQFFADGGDGHNGKEPANATAERETEHFAYVAVGTFLHEERTTHDSTVYSNKREENAKGIVECRGSFLNYHLDHLDDGCNDGNEHDKAEKRKVDIG